MNILAYHTKHRFVLMMHFVIFVQGRELVEEAVKPHVYEVISNHDNKEGLEDLETCR